MTAKPSVDDFAAEYAKAKRSSREALLTEHVIALRKRGLSLRAISDRLNREGWRTARGGKWASTTVQRILDRSAPGLSQSPHGSDRDVVLAAIQTEVNISIVRSLLENT